MRGLIAPVAIFLTLAACSVEMATSGNVPLAANALGLNEKDIIAKPTAASVVGPGIAKFKTVASDVASDSHQMVPSANVTDSPYWIQLAAAASLSKADEESLKLQAMWPSMFERWELVIFEQYIAGRGIFYRVQAGGFDTLQEAQSMCAALQAKKQACFALKRN